MTRRGRRAYVGAAAVVLTVGLASCASSAQTSAGSPTPTWFDATDAAALGADGNGLWLQDGTTAAAQVIAAAREGGAVTVTAHVQEQTTDADGAVSTGRSLDLTRAGDADAYRLSFSLGDQSGELVRIGQQVWARGNASFAAHYGLPDYGGFSCVLVSSAVVTELAPLTDPGELLTAALTGLEIGVLAPAADGDTASLVIGTGGAPIGSVDVASTGAPLPLHLVAADATGTVEADFAWGSVESVTAPDEAIECG